MAATRIRLQADWGDMDTMEKSQVIAFFMDAAGGSVSGNNVKIGQIAITGVQGAAIRKQMEAAGYEDFNAMLRDFYGALAEGRLALRDITLS